MRDAEREEGLKLPLNVGVSGVTYKIDSLFRFTYHPVMYMGITEDSQHWFA